MNKIMKKYILVFSSIFCFFISSICLADVAIPPELLKYNHHLTQEIPWYQNPVQIALVGLLAILFILVLIMIINKLRKK